MTVEAANPTITAISAASRANCREFHREARGVIGMTFVRFANPVKKPNKPELLALSDLSRRIKIGRPNKQKR